MEKLLLDASKNVFIILVNLSQLRHHNIYEKSNAICLE